jgi:hypothetical protein
MTEKAAEARCQPETGAAVSCDCDAKDVISQLLEAGGGSTGMARTLAVGEVLLRRYFGGDPEVWRDRRRNKGKSLRALAARDDCPLSKSALSEAVRVYVAVGTLPCVRQFTHVGSSHVIAVLCLPEAAREALLMAAEANRWTVRQFRIFVGERQRVPDETSDDGHCSRCRAQAAARGTDVLLQGQAHSEMGSTNCLLRREPGSRRCPSTESGATGTSPRVEPRLEVE